MDETTAVLEGRRVFAVEQADALHWLRSLPDACVDLILTDPPYFMKKQDCAWDRAWKTDGDFLAWIGLLCEQWRRVLSSNGSLYVFASPEMAGRVECRVREAFTVLNHIVWSKADVVTYSAKYGEERFRQCVPKSERIIFAEQRGTDAVAMGEAGYARMEKDLHKAVYAPIGAYLQQERERAGLTRNQVEVALGYVSSSDPTRGTALCCRWEEGSALPTRAAYGRFRDLLDGTGGSYLARDYDDLRREFEDKRREFEDKRREFEDKRREFEDKRRPFNASPDTPYTDVWDFPTVQDYPGKHPCEKPLSLLKHIITLSSRPDSLVLDCFTGSGNTGRAAVDLDRRFIGCDLDPKWVAFAQERIGCRQLALFAA